MGLFRHHRTAPVEATAATAANEDTFETHFLRYLRTFDGTKRDFSEVEALFNELYYDDFYENKNDTLVTKDQVKEAHTRLFEIGSKVTLMHFKQKRPDQIDIKYRIFNAEKNRTIHQLIIIKDKKIIRAEDLDKQEERREEKEIRREEMPMGGYPTTRREERMMYADPYMMDPYADPYRRGGLMHDVRRDERMIRRDERMCRRW